MKQSMKAKKALEKLFIGQQKQLIKKPEWKKNSMHTLCKTVWKVCSL